MAGTSPAMTWRIPANNDHRLIGANFAGIINKVFRSTR
jgi:hypothetical protein